MKFSKTFYIVLLASLMLEFAIIGTAFYKVARRLSVIEAAIACGEHYNRIMDRYHAHASMAIYLAAKLDKPRNQLTLGDFLGEYIDVNTECVQDLRGPQ